MVSIEEQGLRDGLQTLKTPVSVELRLDWIDRLVRAGLQRLQIGAFVHPEKVPMMACTDELFKKIRAKNYEKNITFSALVLNVRGVERAVDAGVAHLSISLSASSTHSVKNTGKDIESSKQEVKQMILLAKKHGIRVRGGIQCAFGCRYEGNIQGDVVCDLAKFLLDQGIDELSLADSTGMGYPLLIEDRVGAVKLLADDKPLGLHLHNTENKGYANVLKGIAAGVTIIDTAFGGLGGCPFIKGATGNVATEDVVHLLRQSEIDTGIDIRAVAQVSQQMEELLGMPLPGLLYKLVQRPDIKFND